MLWPLVVNYVLQILTKSQPHMSRQRDRHGVQGGTSRLVGASEPDLCSTRIPHPVAPKPLAGFGHVLIWILMNRDSESSPRPDNGVSEVSKRFVVRSVDDIRNHGCGLSVFQSATEDTSL